MDGDRLWDIHDRYGDTFTADYCRACPAACADCPRPQLLPQARPAAEAYLRVRTQWNLAPSGLPIGLRHADCIATLRLCQRDLRVGDRGFSRLWAQVCMIEQAYAAAMVEVFDRRRAEAEAQSRNGRP